MERVAVTDKGERKMKGNRKKYIAIVIIALVASIAIAAGILIKQKDIGTAIDGVLYSNTPYNSTVPYKLFEPSGLNRTVDALMMNPVYNDLTKDYRPRWTGCTDEEFVQIFERLPKMPQDFYKKYSMFMNGEITDYDRLGPEYWQQPEFYGMDQNSFSNYINRATGMWTPGTISCKPSARQIEMKKGASVSISTFFHGTIEGSEAYLGTIFTPLFPNAALNYDGIKVFDQPADATKYIHATITGPDNDTLFESRPFQKNISGLYTNLGPGERLVLFSPTYQKIDTMGVQTLLGFRPDWCCKVTLAISIASNCPTGTYDVAIDMKNPSDAVNQEYNWVISGYPYYSLYFPAIREWRPICPFFQAIITVV